MEDFLSYKEYIQPVCTSELRKVQFVDVEICFIYNPSNFWIQIIQNGIAKLEIIIDQLNFYYNHGEGKDRKLAVGKVRVGQYCTVEYYGSWHRAVIVNIEDGDYVKVFHIDFGSVTLVKAEYLKPLRREWAELPAQAIHARLVDLVPAHGLISWPKSATNTFENLVRDSRLVAEIVNVLPGELQVKLFDTVNPVCINNVLIDKEYAEFSKKRLVTK